MRALLEVEDLTVEFPMKGGAIRVIDDVSFVLERGETLAILGESGAGKSVMAQALIGLLPPPGEVTAGQVIFDQNDISVIDNSEIRRIRGRHIGFLFQNPGATLNPLQTVGHQISDVASLHHELSRGDGELAALDLLSSVEFDDPKHIFASYPHELSGGMQQRAALAIALAGDPRLLIADEPTAALDAPLRNEILQLLIRLKAKRALSIIVITHDLRVASRLSDRVLLFYAGQVVEDAPTKAFFSQPQHPYGRALLACRPQMTDGRATLPASIDGDIPDFRDLPQGCRFHPRCTKAEQRCYSEQPLIKETTPGQRVACHLEHPK